MEVAICHTARILINALPKVYEPGRQVRVLNEDSSFEMVTLGEQIVDQQTQQTVTLNDLSQGQYDVTCSSGASFKNRQEETVAAMIEIASVDPSIIEIGGDIMMNSIDAPGMDLMRDRKRQQLLHAGAIPESQMSKEELQQAQEAAQQPQSDPAAMALAQAEQAKADAEMAKAQAQSEKNHIDLAKAQANLQIEQQKFQLEQEKAVFMAEQSQAKAASQQEQAEFKLFMEQTKLEMDRQTQEINNLKTQADTLKTIREGMGVDTVVGPHNSEAYINQSVAITEAQEGLGIDTSIGEEVTGSEEFDNQ
jgi:hypothetical protein